MSRGVIKIGERIKIKGKDIKFSTAVISANKTVKVVEGGRRFRISALVAIGDGNGIIGYGIGKGADTASAVAKGENNAKKNLIKVPLRNGTIPHEAYGYYDGNCVFIKQATEGTGLKAGGALRTVCELCGIRNILSKSYRCNSKQNSLRAAFRALGSLQDPLSVAKRRGVSLEKVFKG